MGPRHRCRGSSKGTIVPSRTWLRFNGAATSLSRIADWERVGSVRVKIASMGPRHRCRGSFIRCSGLSINCIGFNGAATSLSRIGRVAERALQRGCALQWGRDIAVADRQNYYTDAHALAVASMGPRHRCRGSKPMSIPTLRSKRLQWGRDIAVADRPTPGPLGGRRRRFNGAATSLSRIAQEKRPQKARSQDASMGPRHRCRGSRATAARECLGRGASMGPRHRCRGSSRNRTVSPARNVRFNGAATSLSRIVYGSGRRYDDNGCFNGAATSLSRIVTYGLGVVPGTPASMGPRHRCRGSITPSLRGLADCTSFNGAATSLSRIVVKQQVELTDRWKLQWGRDIAVADRSASMVVTPRGTVLQWGRDIAVADRSLRKHRPQQYTPASMGPRHRCRGSLIVLCCFANDSKSLQWGRDIAVADRMRAGGRDDESDRSFNGAATSLSRIVRLRVFRRAPQIGFNGAATSLSRIVGKSSHQCNLVQTLQWGRDIAVADRRPTSNGSRSTSQLQWGRDIAVADRAQRTGKVHFVRVLQWGRDIAVADRTSASAACAVAP